MAIVSLTVCDAIRRCGGVGRLQMTSNEFLLHHHKQDNTSTRSKEIMVNSHTVMIPCI
jgi:hypothetical protein